MDDERELTKPAEKRKEHVSLKQVPVRMHPHEHAMLMALLKRDDMSLQKLHNFLVTGYLNADPRVLSFIKEQRELESVPKDVREKHVLSLRERNNIFDQIEKGAK